MHDESKTNDETLKAAIVACRPFKYLDDLKERVAKYLGLPTNTDFGTRIYVLNQKIEHDETQARIDSMGFETASEEVLRSMVGRKVEMLFGVRSMFGESIRPGTIKPDGRDGFVFIPKGNRTKGYVPTFLRLATGEKAGLASSKITALEA